MLRRIWNLLRGDRLHRDLDRELSFHLAERAEEFEAQGMDAREASRQARRQFGNYTSQLERTRNMDINERLAAAVRNLRLAVRQLAKSPGFSVAVVLTLALGIGANSAVFSAIDAVLLKPLPFPESSRLVSIAQVNPKVPQPFVAPTRLEDWNRLSQTFEAISGYYTEDDSETSGALPERLTRALVAPRFLRVWGIAPQLGRDFSPEEEKFGGPNAILISDRLWRLRFAADPNVAGRILRTNGNAQPIIGVMPASLEVVQRDIDLWSVSPPDAPYAQNRNNTWFTAIGRVKSAVSFETAQANLSAVQADLGRRFPATDEKLRISIRPLKDTEVGKAKRSLWLLFASVTLLLLIACTNVAALLLSRAAGKQHEISVRFSLGASRASVATQMLTEVLLLALGGAALGLLSAAGAARVFQSLAKSLPRVDEITLDWRLVTYTLVTALAVTLLCGLWPAVRGTGRNLAGRLAQSGRSQIGRKMPLQMSLVAVQVALAVALLTGAGLLARSFEVLGRVSPGFDAAHVLTFQISANWGETTDQKAGVQRVNRILDGLRTIPGVEAAATAFGLPGMATAYPVELRLDAGQADSEPKIMAEGRTVGAGYFDTLRIPLLSGEPCRETDQPATMMVNRRFADAYLGGRSAVGHAVSGVGPNSAPTAVIRGVVGDARELGIEKEPAPTVYWCYGSMQPQMLFMARTHGDPMNLAETVRRKLRELEPRRSVFAIAALPDQISDSFAENRLRAILLGFFALTAISLAAVGLYGTLSYLVNVRQREVGLRMALGARRGQVVRQFLSQGVSVAALGCAAGLSLSLALSRLIAGMLYGVSPWDGETLMLVSALVLAVAALASLAPSMRAARLDPMRVLREE